MTVGVGFRRARLRYAYMILRGKDLKTGESSDKIREKNFGIFKSALDKVLDLNNWHSFLNILKEAGYISDKLIASSNAVVFSYVLYLIAKYDYQMEAMKLKRLIKRWFFMAALTSFYTGSTESDVEAQFADMEVITSADGLEEYLQNVIASRLTEDYFNITMPMDLMTSAGISPSWYGFVASQIVLGTPLLFGTTPLASVFTLGSSGTKNALDKHHIFPKNYLAKLGIEKDRDRNQTANFTYLDYSTNIHITDKPPQEYIEEYRTELGPEEFSKACSQHALPEDFHTLEYFDFLNQRRPLMAGIIRKAYERLTNG
jgi:hypothetical protein